MRKIDKSLTGRAGRGSAAFWNDAENPTPDNRRYVHRVRYYDENVISLHSRRHAGPDVNINFPARTRPLRRREGPHCSCGAERAEQPYTLADKDKEVGRADCLVYATTAAAAGPLVGARAASLRAAEWVLIVSARLAPYDVIIIIHNIIPAELRCRCRALWSPSRFMMTRTALV